MKKLVCVMLALMLLASTACAEMLDDLFGGLTSVFEADEDVVYAPGETANLDDVDVRLTNVMMSDGGSEYKPGSGNTYLICEFEVYNKSDEAMIISSMLCFSLSVDGKTYQLSLEADAVAMMSGKMQFDMGIDSGETATGIVGYEVPADWQQLKITFKPDPYSSDKAVFVMDR